MRTVGLAERGDSFDCGFQNLMLVMGVAAVNIFAGMADDLHPDLLGNASICHRASCTMTQRVEGSAGDLPYAISLNRLDIHSRCTCEFVNKFSPNFGAFWMAATLMNRGTHLCTGGSAGVRLSAPTLHSPPRGCPAPASLGRLRGALSLAVARGGTGGVKQKSRP